MYNSVFLRCFFIELKQEKLKQIICKSNKFIRNEDLRVNKREAQRITQGNKS